MIICICNNISDRLILDEYNPGLDIISNEELLREKFNIGRMCGCCNDYFIDYLEEINEPLTRLYV